MPNVNLTDSRQRDAVVKAESTGVSEDLRYVDNNGHNAYTRKILKATVDHDYGTLIQDHDDDKDKLAQAIVEGDPEVDMEKCGLFLWGVSKVYVDSEDGIVYRIEQTEIVRDPSGTVKEKRPRQRSEANVDMEIPLTWTGRKVDKGEAVRRFVFASKLQIVHINGLTYDFLFGMAQELAESNSLMMLGAGSKGRDPLIFRSGSIPYRGFLEGRVDGDKYILLLHLSNMELKQFGDADEKAASAKTDDKEKSKEQPKVKPAVKADEVAAKESAEEDNKEAEVAADAKAKKSAKKKPSEVVEAEDKSSEKEKPAKEVAAKEDKKKSTESADEQSAESKPVKKKKTKGKKSDEKVAKNKKEKSASGNSDSGKEQPVKPVKPVAKEAKVAEPPAPVADGAISSQDLGVWLKSIRMGKYLALFIENEIDVDVLSELTDADLKELEIPLGSRRRLLKAVAETDNLRAEVEMAVQTMSGTKAPAKK